MSYEQVYNGEHWPTHKASNHYLQTSFRLSKHNRFINIVRQVLNVGRDRQPNQLAWSRLRDRYKPEDRQPREEQWEWNR